MRRARRCKRRHRRSRWRKLRTGSHGRGARGRSSAEDSMATGGRAGIIKGAFERQSAVDMRMQRERMHTVLSSKRRVEIVDESAVAGAAARAAAGSAAARAAEGGTAVAARAAARAARAARVAARAAAGRVPTPTRHWWTLHGRRHLRLQPRLRRWSRRGYRPCIHASSPKPRWLHLCCQTAHQW